MSNRRATMRDNTIGIRAVIYSVIIAALACAPASQSTSYGGALRAPLAGGWVDVTATLDPATTPVYEGDAPMKFDFLKDMRKGDKLTLSVYSMGAHSGTHIDAPMHFIATGAPVEQLKLDPLIGLARVIVI